MRFFRRMDGSERGPSGGGMPLPRLVDHDIGRMRVRCPRCRWRPGAHDRWSCFCGHAWNTFETGGRCPCCRERWDHTQCLSCHEWSPHEAWYPDRPRD